MLSKIESKKHDLIDLGFCVRDILREDDMLEKRYFTVVR